MSKTTITFAVVIVLAAVFALASPFDTAVAQTSDAMPDGDDNGEREYKDGEHEGKSCPNKEKKSQSIEQSS